MKKETKIKNQKFKIKDYLKFRCQECEYDIVIPSCAEENEIFVCQGCGLELMFKDECLIPLTSEEEEKEEEF